ncbi:MAG: hypothetical protein KF905_17210, partial [Flavobacteriales bacterium]|nr:hypothetical protein [Flavobacteriales bacterium]
MTKPLGQAPTRIEVRLGTPNGALLYAQNNPVMVSGTHTLTSEVNLAAGSTYSLLFYRDPNNNGDGWYDQNVIPGNLYAYDGSSWTSFSAYELRFSLRIVPRIFVNGPPGNAICAGESFSMNFSSESPSVNGHPFTAQLSNASGSFASPVTIGTEPVATVGSIICTIPANTPQGSGYRVRMVYAAPSLSSLNNGSNITISEPTTWYADEDGDGLGNPEVSQEACTQPSGFVGNATDPCPLAVDGIPNFEESTCACELGYFATITDINGNAVITACTICPPGSYCPDGIDAFPCAAGAFSDVSGAIACTSCPAGSFSATTGSTVCTSCPAGSFSDVVGSVACVPCAAGFANGSIGQTSCTACPPGSFSANSGQVECDLCPAGTFNPVSAAVSCTVCPIGESSGEGAVECILDVICEDVTLEFYTGNTPADLSWEIEDVQSNTVVVTGQGFVMPPDAVFPFVYCLPIDREYKLRVTDNGDGASGYQLRYTATQARMIDNQDNLGTGTSEITGNAYSFSLPVGSDELIYTSCDKYWWKTNEYIVVDENPAVSALWIDGGANNVQSNNTGYEFWFYNPNGGYSFRKFRPHNVSDGYGNVGATRACHLKVNNWAV